MTNHQKQCAYVAQLRAFQDHLNACFDVLMNTGATDETVDIFYNSEFEIIFRGKKVTLANGATVFQALEEVIQTEIDDCEEV